MSAWGAASAEGEENKDTRDTDFKGNIFNRTTHSKASKDNGNDLIRWDACIPKELLNNIGRKYECGR